MNAIHSLNLGVRFVLELCLLAALAYWGYWLEQSRIVRLIAAVGAPLLAATAWGVFVAPKATYRLEDPWRFGLELLLFGLGAAALMMAQQPGWGAALLVTFLANRIILMLTGGVI